MTTRAAAATTSSAAAGRSTWAARLLRWYQRSKRDLPWRNARDAYGVWVSEIMLQQTRVDTVIPYYRRFMERFPTIKALARSDVQDVLQLWAGLGYYARARRLHQAATLVVSRHGGRLPGSYAALRTLPGLGEYCAAAVASIAFGEPVPVVDGNVLRVCARFLAIEEDVRTRAARDRIVAHLQPAIASCDPSSFNQALMELGALVCTPRAPRCAECPLRADCRARALGRADELPVLAKRAATPHYEVAVGVIRRGRRILLARRPERGMLGGMWEFPGGKRLPGETLEQAAAREVAGKTGLRVTVETPCITLRHAYSHFRITLSAFECRVDGGRLNPRGYDELVWVPAHELAEYPLPATGRRIAEATQRLS